MKWPTDQKSSTTPPIWLRSYKFL